MLKVVTYNKLMVVAHPDDELIFGGAQLITDPGWKVICITKPDKKDRKYKFIEIMKKLKCRWEVWRYTDRFRVGFVFPQERLIKDLTRVLNERDYKKVVTHDFFGDHKFTVNHKYNNHPQHCLLHTTLKKLVGNDLWVFGCGELLPDDLWQQKLKFLEMYAELDKRVRIYYPRAMREKIQPVFPYWG